MDGREAMALASGSAPYFIHRGGGIVGAGSGSQIGPIHVPPGFRPLSNPNLAAQSNVRPGSSGPAFSMEPSNANFAHGINIHSRCLEEQYHLEVEDIASNSLRMKQMSQYRCKRKHWSTLQQH
ncbi:hypothetical protein MANES_09G077227v8 [Manihot esculenta]|uniref:Uncharacterized protein n=2 Tax=Manihot esculenta TaxID=3983 RepID=A0ACB7H412_MANES|nr:hypothetical protein MANES_09G077227v8 [Manihot esculenta]KAG8647449.1 hypothetical protein MANES_09G077227v8 [Manihot esculenta]